MFKLFRLTILIALVGILFTACTAKSVTVTPTVDNPYKPQTGDDAMIRGDAEIVSVSSILTTSIPPEVSVLLAYRLPTPCYQLRVSISQPDSQNRINLEIYGVAPKDKPCTLMALATPLEASVKLGVFPVGNYIVWVNGQQSAEFSVK